MVVGPVPVNEPRTEESKGTKEEEEHEGQKVLSQIMFNSKSAAAPPCKGRQEHLAPGDSPEKYPILLKNRDFRKILSAFYTPAKPIELGGRLFATAEHIHHWQKFQRLNPKFAVLFEYGSGSVFARNPVLAKAAGGKRGVVKVDKKVVYKRPSDVKLDPQWQSNASQLKQQYLDVKFEQDPLSRSILLATRNARLVHWTRGMKTSAVETEMMRVRAKLVGSSESRAASGSNV